jgi:cation-transporting ATPase E
VRTLIDFVVPAAATSALLGLVVFYGTLLIDPAVAPVAGIPHPATLAEARSALTTFLVLSGLLLVPFVAPPSRWFAVVDPVADDLRPAVLTVILAAAFLVMALTSVGRAFFDLVPLRGNAALLVIGGIIVWFVVVRTAWKLKLLNRFVGA